MYSAELKISDREDLPQPKGYKLLIAIPSIEEKSKGGIIIPDVLKDQEKTASIYGYVVSLGSDAYADADKFPNGPYCNEGDWVIFRSYSGTRLKINGDEYRLINDDTVEAVINDPRIMTRA